MTGTPRPLQFRASPSAFNAFSSGRSGTSRGQAADWTFAEALFAVPPSGAGPSAAARNANVPDLRSTSGRDGIDLHTEGLRMYQRGTNQAEVPFGLLLLVRLQARS